MDTQPQQAPSAWIPPIVVAETMDEYKKLIEAEDKWRFDTWLHFFNGQFYPPPRRMILPPPE